MLRCFHAKVLSKGEQAKHADQLYQLKEAFSVLRAAGQQDFNSHLNAVNFAWLDSAWSKYCWSKHIDLKASIDFNGGLDRELENKIPGFKECKSLSGVYSDAFGSSFTDGNTATANVFVRNILRDFDQKTADQHPEEVRQATLFFSDQFIDIYYSCMAGLKSHHVIS